MGRDFLSDSKSEGVKAKTKIKYITVEDTLYCDELSTAYRTFGIAVLENGRRTYFISDISLDRSAVDSLVRKCNKYSLDPVHLPDVVDDLLVELYS